MPFIIPDINAQFIVYFNLTVTNSIPTTILAIFSVLTWYDFYVTRNNLEQQVNRMMIVEFIMIFMSSSPNFIYNVYAQITQSIVKSELRIGKETLWRNVCVTLSLILNIGTLYIYLVVSPIFRQNLLLSLSCRKSNRIRSEKIHLTR